MSFQDFQVAQPAVFEWLVSEAPRFEFAASLLQAVAKYGYLTPKQLAAAQKCAARKAESEASKKVAEQAAPKIETENLLAAFEHAIKKGLKRPKLRFQGFEATLAPKTGKNPGAVYLKSGAEYLGKITGGKLQTVRSCPSETEEAIKEAMADPLAAAVAYGRRSGSCSCCGRELTVEKSVEAGIGPICAAKFGL